jgi:hypothetical protein
LDVKARLNAMMRRMVRVVSGKEEAEMKWTKPETLVTNYGVKVVGWPGYRGLVSSLAVPVASASAAAETTLEEGNAALVGSSGTIPEVDVTADVGEGGKEEEHGTAAEAEAEAVAVAAVAAAHAGDVEEDEEPIPLRNPSNNSVK